MQFFHTQTTAQELEALSEAIAVMNGQLRERRLFGIASLILELFTETDAQEIRIAITEQQHPNMFDMPGEERWLHCSVTVQPGDRLLDVPSTIFQPSVLGESDVRIARTDAIIEETLPMSKVNHEMARLRLSQHLQPLFQTILHRVGVNLVTQR